VVDARYSGPTNQCHAATGAQWGGQERSHYSRAIAAKLHHLLAACQLHCCNKGTEQQKQQLQDLVPHPHLRQLQRYKKMSKGWYTGALASGATQSVHLSVVMGQSELAHTFYIINPHKQRQ
jgi:hypothetical protein